MTFPQTILRFRQVPSFLGLASFDQKGDMIDTNLPLSDLLCEEIGACFLGIIQQCHDVGRTQNHFAMEYGTRTLVFAEHNEGSLLMMLDDQSQLDNLLALFGNHYRQEQNVITFPTQEIAPEVVTSQNTRTRRKKNPLLWAVSGLTAAVALAAAVPSTDTNSLALDDSEAIAMKAKEAEIKMAAEKAKAELMAAEKAKAAAELAKAKQMQMEAEKAARMEAERLAMEEKVRMEAEQAAAEEAARVAAEQAAAEEAARVAAEQAAAEEAARLEAIALEKAAAKKAAAKKAAAKKAAAKRKARSRKSSSRKKKMHCQN